MASAEDPDQTKASVTQAFAQQHIAYDNLADRVKKMRLTNQDKELLFRGGKHPGNPELLKRIKLRQEKLEAGEWSGPSPIIGSGSLSVGDIGRLDDWVMVVAVLSDAKFVARTLNLADAKPYLVKGYDTSKMATGSKWAMGGIVVCTGTEQVGLLRCLVVEPMSAFKPTKQEVLDAKTKLKFQAAGKPKK